MSGETKLDSLSDPIDAFSIKKGTEPIIFRQIIEEDPLNEEPPSVFRRQAEEDPLNGEPRYNTIQRPAGEVRLPWGAGSYKPSPAEAHKVEKRLPEDTFSMIFIAPWKTWPFWFGMTVAFFQYMTYILVLVDITDTSNGTNPFGFPANVDIAVRIAEVFALIILVPLQDEVLEGFIILSDGYQKEAMESKFPGVSRGKYYLSVSIRLVVGFLSILSSFILIMVESEVLDIFFNFIALQFINDLDNLGFNLVSQGILGSIIRGTANEITDTSYYTDGTFRRKLPLLFVFLATLAAWVWILVLQESGKFVTYSIECQFGDDLDPALATFSGVYERESNPTKSGRFNYVDRLSKRAFFGYCLEDEVWTFSYNSSDACDYLLRSAKTQTYDITETILWEIGVGSSFVPLVPFFMASFYRDEENPCENGGTYKDGRCSCRLDTFGRRCELPTPCQELILDTSSPDFKGSKDTPTSYIWLHDDDEKPVTVYDHPVYVDRILNTVVLFNGRRWIMTNTASIGVSSIDDLPLYLENGLQLYDNAVRTFFITGPSDIGTPSSRSSPIGKTWYFTSLDDGPRVPKPQLNLPAVSVFDCYTCDTTLYPCMYGNACVQGICNCSDGSSGYKCQIVPGDNGFCDTSFNTWNFGFDLGDCCRASCVSTAAHSCGYIGRVEVGFPNCTDNSYSCRTGETCWAPQAVELKTLQINGQSFAWPPLVRLSQNGRIAVLAYPILALVQVFDQVEGFWKQRGEDFVGSLTMPIFGLSIHTVQGSVLDYVLSPIGIRIAFGRSFRATSDETVAYDIVVLDWKDNRLVPNGPVITFMFSGGYRPNFDFFGQGRYLAVQVAPDTVSIFDTQSNNTEIASVSCLSLGIVCRMGSLTSVSEDGSLLLQSNSSELFYAVRSFEGLSNATWTRKVVTANVDWAALSRDGRTVATFEDVVDANFKFFTLQEDGSTWIKRGEAILVGEDWTFSGLAATMSVDGLTAAFGLSQRNGMNGHVVKAFRFSAESGWYQLADSVDAGSVLSMSASYDSSKIVIADNSGVMRALSYLPFCRAGESYYRIFMLLDQDQYLLWSLRHNSSNSDERVLTGPLVYDGLNEYRKVLHEICLPIGGCSVLNITVYPLRVDRVPLISVHIDHKEVLNILPSNSTHFFGDC